MLMPTTLARLRFSLIALFSLLLLILEPAQTFAADEQIDEAEQKAIEAIIKDYLLTHPAVVGEALENYLAQRDTLREAQAREEMAKNWDALTNEQTAFIAGNPDAKVTVIEFFDYNCGYCRIATPSVLKALEENKDVRVIFREFPIRGADSEAVSRAALAARSQGKYIELHSQLMQVEDRMTLDRFDEIAGQLGLDVDLIHETMMDDSINDVIAKNFILASKLNVEGTPSFIVGDKILYGWPGEEAFSQIITEQGKL